MSNLIGNWVVRPKRQFDGFMGVIHNCDLMDFGFDDFKYTWSKRKGVGDNVQVRLDKAPLLMLYGLIILL